MTISITRTVCRTYKMYGTRQRTCVSKTDPAGISCWDPHGVAHPTKGFHNSPREKDSDTLLSNTPSWLSYISSSPEAKI